MIVRFLLVSIFMLVGVFIITQVVIPMLRNRPLFPNLRSNRRSLEGQQAQARGDYDEAVLSREVREEIALVERIKKGTEAHPNE